MVNSKRLLLIIGWVNVVAALLLFQAFCGLMAICMGFVLKKGLSSTNPWASLDSSWYLEYCYRLVAQSLLYVKMTKNLDSWSFYN